MAKNLKIPVGVRMTEAEVALLEKVSAKFAGNKTAAIVAGLRALDSAKEPSKADLLAMIERRLK